MSKFLNQLVFFDSNRVAHYSVWVLLEALKEGLSSIANVWCHDLPKTSYLSHMGNFTLDITPYSVNFGVVQFMSNMSKRFFKVYGSFLSVIEA
jgi:hypothetical protein